MIKVKYEGVTAGYGKKTVVQDFSLDIHESEILGIVGPSGCGKTTLVRALCGFLNPTEGNIYLNGELIYSKEKRVNIPPERRGIGIVFQDYAVWPHMTVEENVAYPLKKRKIPKEEIPKRVHHALEQVNMLGYEKYIPSQLSGGQQQRVAIARALAGNPSLILADEPTGNLDSKTGAEVMALFHELHEAGNTIVLITHDAKIAAQTPRAIHIHDGKVLEPANEGEVIV
ncbi:MAG: ABC transporter ATP-binding protein [Clostridia bacterium]|nr:ABC transporter ATP-binding protein [Clostridia bacterium]